MTQKITIEECEAICRDIRQRLGANPTEEEFMKSLWLRLRHRLQMVTDEAAVPKYMIFEATLAERYYHDAHNLLEENGEGDGRECVRVVRDYREEIRSHNRGK